MVELSITTSQIQNGRTAKANDLVIPLNQLKTHEENMLNGIQAFQALLVGSGAMDASAIAQFSSTSKGLLIPRMTTVQRDAISSPSESLLIWNTTTKTYNYYDLGWKVLGNTGGSMTEIVPTTALSASTGVSIPGIAAVYRDLILRLRIRSSQASVTDSLAIRFNNDSGASNYIWNQYYGQTSTISNANDTADDAIDILCPGASATANRFLDIELHIMDYTSINRISGWYRGALAENTFYATWGAFEWVGGAALNRIDFDVIAGATFDGSYSLYGQGAI